VAATVAFAIAFPLVSSTSTGTEVPLTGMFMVALPSAPVIPTPTDAVPLPGDEDEDGDEGEDMDPQPVIAADKNRQSKLS
jgi:hypothetical protein